ncbi:hypothetical protein T265_04065 [Opisthorchis viverrini]|uniref:Uncharacterized protein n=1 Tax=Opisthorchis viverrini TaxID=6198 RepID=A0A075AH35_OPIVI|nr:hypothetical protein T265_04065 [Opisthorchis viverrini]KER29324.1 hypothetical protein T265_04065 [Opisthorchis viverrini]
MCSRSRIPLFSNTGTCLYDVAGFWLPEDLATPQEIDFPTAGRMNDSKPITFTKLTGSLRQLSRLDIE